jgi:hypothetical protein
VRVVYIAHPLGPDGPERDRNRKNAARWCAWLAWQFDIAPIADWIILSGEWAESSGNRERGLAIDFALIAHCDEVWLVGGRVSPGMGEEVGRATQLGKRIYDLTRFGFDAPAFYSRVHSTQRRDIAEIVGMP